MTSRRTAAMNELRRSGHENPSTVHVATTSDINSDRLGHKMPATPHRVYEHGEMAADGLKRGGVVGHSPKRRRPPAAPMMAPAMPTGPMGGAPTGAPMAPPMAMADDGGGMPMGGDAPPMQAPFRRGGRV